MEQKENSFVSAITGKKLPILTLDHKWHQLFTQVNVTPEIKAGEEKLNTLLKRQGKINTETKEIKKIICINFFYVVVFYRIIIS